ncbi:MAG: FumA C-terminus/TtdB family hydratase beta subunit [Nitrososphaeria archaeon]
MEYSVEVVELSRRSMEFRVGDIIYINGEVAFARDRVHKHLSLEREILQELVGLPIYHCGPIAVFDGVKYVFLAAGPTTSIRMDQFIEDIVSRYRTPAIIGKGGLGILGKNALKKYKSIYCDFPGGASAYATKRVKRVEKVLFKEFGLSEALWIVSVREFGPLLVTHDAKGGDFRHNLHLSKSALERVLFEQGL